MFPSTKHAALGSLLRKKTHQGVFGPLNTLSSVQIPKQLFRSENKSILKAILQINAGGPSVIPPIIDHWTTQENLQNIIEHKAFFGNHHLTANKIPFSKNALCERDAYNLDSNIICFCPGGFVDPIALINKQNHACTTVREDLVRVSIDLNKAQVPGLYNTFFKVVDLCVQGFKIDVVLTKDLSVTIKKNPKISGLELHFSYKNKTENIELIRDELIYYGDLSGINRFCILLPFFALQFCENVPFRKAVYQELAAQSPEDLEKILITLAQQITTFSEYNFNGILPLTPGLIHDIHHAKQGLTYHLNQLSDSEYNRALSAYHTGTPLNAPSTDENIIWNVLLWKRKFDGWALSSALYLLGKKIAIRDDDYIMHPDLGKVEAKHFKTGSFRNGRSLKATMKQAPAITSNTAPASQSVLTAFKRQKTKRSSDAAMTLSPREKKESHSSPSPLHRPK